VRSKIEIGGSILEQLRQINCLRCELNVEGEPHFDNNTDSKEYAALLGNNSRNSVQISN